MERGVVALVRSDAVAKIGCFDADCLLSDVIADWSKTVVVVVEYRRKIVEIFLKIVRFLKTKVERNGEA